jgi:RNA polymerase sigma-70 factor (ECF subfamily)
MNVLGWAERQRLLRRLSRVARDRDNAEELLQSAFVRLTEYKRRQTVENEAGFLVHAATNLAIDEARKRSIRPEIAVGADCVREVKSEVPLQDEALLIRERLARVREALSRLPERTRDAFLMHRVSGMSYAQIAAHFGVSVSAIEKHIAKATLFLADWADRERAENR